MPFTLSRASCALIVAAVILPVSNVVLAEEAGRRIEEVIVTAERKEASIQDTSISISAFTDQFMDDFGIRNQEDLRTSCRQRRFSLMTPRFVVLVVTSGRLAAIRVFPPI